MHQWQKQAALKALTCSAVNNANRAAFHAWKLAQLVKSTNSHQRTTNTTMQTFSSLNTQIIFCRWIISSRCLGSLLNYNQESIIINLLFRSSIKFQEQIDLNPLRSIFNSKNTNLISSPAIPSRHSTLTECLLPSISQGFDGGLWTTKTEKRMG